MSTKTLTFLPRPPHTAKEQSGLFRDGDAALCEVVVGFGADFIEWSINVNGEPTLDACGIAEELARRSIANSR